MRDILFRGKRKDNGEWVEGSLVHQTAYYGDPVDCYHILYSGEFDYDYYDAAEVIPETIGQFTGLFDKNGKMIFEGDVIKDEYGITKSVKFYRGYYCPFVAFPDYRCWDESRCEVTGNIHDNPGYLEDK